MLKILSKCLAPLLLLSACSGEELTPLELHSKQLAELDGSTYLASDVPDLPPSPLCRSTFWFTPVENALWQEINVSAAQIRTGLAQGGELFCRSDTIDNRVPVLNYVLARNYDWNLVKEIIDRGANLNWRDSFGNTSLHAAAAGTGSDKQKIIVRLLNAGVSVNAPNFNRDTPLHLAAFNDTSGENVRLLLNRGASPTTMNRMGSTPLHSAALNDNAKAAEAILQHSPVAGMLRDTVGQKTPLQVAQSQGHTKTAQVLSGGRVGFGQTQSPTPQQSTPPQSRAQVAITTAAPNHQSCMASCEQIRGAGIRSTMKLGATEFQYQERLNRLCTDKCECVLTGTTTDSRAQHWCANYSRSANDIRSALGIPLL